MLFLAPLRLALSPDAATAAAVDDDFSNGNDNNDENLDEVAVKDGIDLVLSKEKMAKG